jgi:hypothetical protein
MRVITLCFCIVAICAGFSGCATAQKPSEASAAVEREEVVNEISLEEYFRVEAEKGGGIDPATKVVGKVNKITFKGIRSVVVKEYMRVDALVLNDRGRRDIFSYRVRWLDKDGFVAGTYDKWETMALEGHQQAVLTVRAPLKAMKDYRLEIMSAN